MTDYQNILYILIFSLISTTRQLFQRLIRFARYLNHPEPDGQISKWRKFLLAFPSLPGNLSSVLIHNAFLKYYTDIIGLDAKYVGLVYLIFGIWNAINDPAIGVLIDRRKYDEKKGKLLYLMRVTVPVALISAFAMVHAQPDWNQWVIFGFLLLMLFFYDTAMTTYGIAYASYILVSAPSTRERVDVSMVTTYVANVGGLLGTLIPTLLLVGNTNRQLTTILLTAVIGINALLYFLALKPLRETREMYSRENEAIDRKGLMGDLVVNARDALKSRAFVSYLLYQLIAKGPKSFYFTPFLYLMDHVLHLQGVQATVVDILPGLFMLALAPFIAKSMKVFGIRKTAIFSTVPAAFGFLLIYFVNGFFSAICAYAVMYLFTSAFEMAHGPMLGAIIDDDELRTGVRKAGMYTGLNALLTIPVSGIQASIFMGVITAFGFVSGQQAQPDSALQGIRIGAGLVPFAFTLVGVVPLLFSPIHKNREMELSAFSVAARRSRNEETSEVSEQEGAHT